MNTAVKVVVRVVASIVVVVGIFLLVRVLLAAVNGTLPATLFPQADPSLATPLLALVLSLPVPCHVIAVGLIVQKRWLTPAWARFAWFAVVTSGCWLGAALLAKALMR